MKITKKFLSLLAIAAMTVACSSNETPQETPPTPPPTEEQGKYPEDPNPTKFDGFFKRTVMVDHTGVDCPYCPRVIKPLNDIAKSADGDKILVIAAHTFRQDPMKNTFASMYSNYCGASSYPTVNLDLRKTSDASFDSGTVSSIMSKRNKLEEKYPAKVAIAAAVNFDGTNFIVNTGVKVGVTGTYNIGITVLEDGIKAEQSNGVGATGYDFNIHNHVIRGGMPSTSVTGKALKEGTINAGEVINTDFTVPVPAKTKAANVSIVVYVACPDTEGGTKYYINNAIVCKPGESVPFKYKE